MGCIVIIRCKEGVLDFVDVNEVFERIGKSNKETIEKLLINFYSDYNGMDLSVIDLLGKNKYDEALNIVYLVKGAAGNLGMKKLYEDSINLELAIKTYVDGNIFIALPHFVDSLKSILSMFIVEESDSNNLNKEIVDNVVIVIDRDTLSGNILSQIIKEEGHNVFVYNNTFDGLKDIINITELGGRIKCVITEVALPGINGLDLIKYIRNINTTYRIPIIISSSISDGFVIKELRKADIDGYILKPYNRKLILERLTKIN